jgi:hypothetical protein
MGCPCRTTPVLYRGPSGANAHYARLCVRGEGVTGAVIDL